MNSIKGQNESDLVSENLPIPLLCTARIGCNRAFARVLTSSLERPSNGSLLSLVQLRQEDLFLYKHIFKAKEKDREKQFLIHPKKNVLRARNVLVSLLFTAVQCRQVHRRLFLTDSIAIIQGMPSNCNFQGMDYPTATYQNTKRNDEVPLNSMELLECNTTEPGLTWESPACSGIPPDQSVKHRGGPQRERRRRSVPWPSQTAAGDCPVEQWYCSPGLLLTFGLLI